MMMYRDHAALCSKPCYHAYVHHLDWHVLHDELEDVAQHRNVHIGCGTHMFKTKGLPVSATQCASFFMTLECGCHCKAAAQQQIMDSCSIASLIVDMAEYTQLHGHGN